MYFHKNVLKLELLRNYYTVNCHHSPYLVFRYELLQTKAPLTSYMYNLTLIAAQILT